MYLQKEFLNTRTVYWFQYEPFDDGVDIITNLGWFGSLNIKFNSYLSKILIF